jgi:plastocyanin
MFGTFAGLKSLHKMKAKLFLTSTVVALMAAFSLSATVHNVSVSSNQFTPSSLTITAGDTVVWTNTGGFHNVNGNTSTAANASNPASFGNGSASSSSWTYQFIFNTAGTYNYQCDPHVGFGMTGTVTVNPASPSLSGVVMQSFENSGGTWTYVLNPASYNAAGGTDVWDTVSSLSSINPSSGANFWGMQDLDNGNGGGSFGHTMDFDPVSLTGLANVKVKFDYYTIGYESSDSLAYVVEFDNGMTWGALTELNKNSLAWVTEEITVPMGSTHARLRIYAKQNGGSDFAAIDNVRIDTTTAQVGGTPLYNIAQINTSDANGVADSIGVNCQVTGIVHSIDFDGNNGYSFYIYDNTGGINVFNFNDVTGYTSPLVGDSLALWGDIGQFNGLTQFGVDSIVVLGSGASVKAPRVEFAADESTEGDYIKLNGYRLLDASQWPTSGNSASVDITNGTDTVVMRIDSDTDIDGSTAPVGSFNVTGAGGQFDNSSPFTEGHQILPSSLTDIEAVSASTLPLYTIAQVTTNDANGVADSANVVCELRGIVFTTDFDGNAGYGFYIYDATGGINVFNFSDVNNYTSPQVGDSIHVFGNISQFNGLTQIFADSIVLWGTNTSLITPAVVTDFDETTESEYIRINNVSLVDATQWPASGSNANVDITDGTDTLVMRIDRDTDIDGTPAPIGQFDVIGNGGQFDSSSPFDEGYQIFPSSLNDILLAPPANPTVNYISTTMNVMEDVGTFDVELVINPVSTVNDTIVLQAVLGSNVTYPGDGTLLPAPDPVTGIFEIPVPANEDTVSFSISIVDDAIIEGNETLFININSVSPGLLVGPQDSYTLVVMDNDAPVAGIPTYPIATVTTSDVTGIADSSGVECKVVGVIHSIDFDGNAGYGFYIYDNTGGINIFNFNDVGTYTSPAVGDSIRAIGTVSQFNGLTQLTVDSIVLLGSGITLKMPQVVTNLDETTEGEYIRMNGVTVVTPSQWPTAGNSGNVDITDGVNTFTMRIDSDTDIDGTPVPVGQFDVIGAGGQFDFSSPFTGGYQILPSDTNDIMPVIATTPTINFPAAAQSQLESAGTITITMPIAPVSASAETVKILVNNGAGATLFTDYSTTPVVTMDTITLNVAANASSVSFDIVIVDDILQESDEDITFTIASTSAGISAGIPSVHVFTILDNDTPIPTYNITDVVGVDVDGVADSLGVYCKLVGVVTTPQLSATRTDFFITNAANTAGLKVNRSSLIAYNAVVGDEIRVIGTISQFNGGIQIDPDSVVVIGPVTPIAPTLITTNLGESTEGRVIRLNDVEIVDTTGWPAANFGNFDIELATGDTVTLRLDSDLLTSWGPAPLGKFDVIGVGGQFDPSNPYTDDYQINPRIGAEIIRKVAKLAITEVMVSSNASSPIDGDWFELTNYGTTDIDLDGFSWDDDSRTAGRHEVNTSYTIQAGESVIFIDGLVANETAWLTSWRQAATGLRVISEDEFAPIGFSGLSSGGDEVNFYDDLGQVVSAVVWASSDVSAGTSIEFDTTGTLVGNSVSGSNGAYTSNDGEVGSPGNTAPIGIEEFLLNDVSLYPNPATSAVSILTNGNEEKAITITSLTGKLVESKVSTEETIELNVSDLPKGVYIVNIQMGNASASRKLIVQ